MSQPVTYTGVVAMAPDRGIGYRGALPWHLPDDLKTFKRITTGHPVIRVAARCRNSRIDQLNHQVDEL